MRLVTPHVTADPIVCSEFREGINYTNWRPRGSGDWLFIFTMEGVGRVGLGSRDLRLTTGDALLFSPGARQDYSTDTIMSRWHLRWAHFKPKPDWCPWLLWPEVAPRTGLIKLNGPTATAVASALERMLIAQRLGGKNSDDLAMNALEEALIRAFRFSADKRTTTVDERIQRAARYLATHPSEPFSLPALAAHCGLSVSRLSHLFRAVLGTTPQRFSEKIRLDYARGLLLQTNSPVNDIASEVGFTDSFYFSRRYKKTFGRAPSQERTQAQPALD